MAQNITLLGASYSAVPAVTLPKTGGGTARFDDCTVVTATASDVASGKVFVAADGTITNGTASGGGGGVGTLLATLALGTISTSSTTATDTGKSVSVSGINDYDLLIVETSVNTPTNNRHTSTVRVIFLTASTNVTTKNGATIVGNTWNEKLSSTGVASTRQGTTAYGIYPNSCSVSNGTATIGMYQRYNSTSTGTINGSYTTRVYGVSLHDLVGG